MEEKKIKERREYMREYYLKNKSRYKNGKYTKKKDKTTFFSIVKKDIIISFQ